MKAWMKKDGQLLTWCEQRRPVPRAPNAPEFRSISKVVVTVIAVVIVIEKVM